MLKLLFIGGTGRISAAITKRCVALGHHVYLLNRGNKSTIEGAIHLQGDINDETHVASLIKSHGDFDAVANFINYTPEQVERDIRLFKGRTGQYLFISSTAAYQKPFSHYKVTESTPLHNPYWQYARDKIACEARLMEEYRNGFPITIVRPSHTYDSNVVPVSVYGANGQWQVLKRMLENKPVLVHGDGLSLWTLTHSDDFAIGFTGLLGNIQALGEAVHITSDESLTWDQIYTAIGNALGVKAKPYHVASQMLIAANPGWEGNLLGDKAYSVVFDNSKIKRLVPEYKAVIRFDTGVRRSVETYLANPKTMQLEDQEFDRLTENVIAACESVKALL